MSALAVASAKNRPEAAKAEEAASDPDEVPSPDRKKKAKQEFERNYYNNECLSIMEDFLRLGKHPRVAKKI